MTLSSPVFTIVIPTYNRAHLISRTIDSVLHQNFADFEVLVIDDGSSDNTEDVVSLYKDQRLQYFKKANGERGAARNFGVKRARGLYINFIDSDDLLYVNHLEVAHKMLSNLEQPEFFHLGYDYKLPDGTIFRYVNNFDDSIKNILLFDNKLSCDGVFLRKDIAEKFPFEENRVLASSEDWALWITLICRYKLHFSNEVTSSVINHDQRSLRTIAVDEIVTRDLFLIDKFRGDAMVMNMYGNSFNRFIAMRYTFFMLGYSEQNNSRKVLEWAIRALRVYPQVVTHRRFLASLKNTFLKW